MNLIIITGRLADDAEIVNNKFIEATVIEKRKGTGQYADKTFTKYVKVLMYGRDIDKHVESLRAGVFVEVQGEADAEAYTSTRDPNKPKARLKIVGKISVVDIGESEHEPTEQPAPRPSTSRPAPSKPTPPAPAAPAALEDDDIPF